MGWSCHCVSLSLHKNGPPLWVSFSENLSELLQTCCFNVEGANCDSRRWRGSQTILVHSWIWGEETWLWLKFLTWIQMRSEFNGWFLIRCHWWLLCFSNSHADLGLVLVSPELGWERWTQPKDRSGMSVAQRDPKEVAAERDLHSAWEGPVYGSNNEKAQSDCSGGGVGEGAWWQRGVRSPSHHIRSQGSN